MTRILVLGHRQGIDDAIVRRGLEPFFVVERVKPQLARRPYAQVASLEDAQEVLRVVLARGMGDLAAVVTGHEEAVFSAALLRSAFGLPGDADYARTLRFRDKYLQKRALPDDVPHARCEYATPATAYEKLAAALGRPFVVKPANGFGAEHTRVVRSAAELEDYWDTGAAASDVRTVAESFVTGEELHVDGAWRGGRVVWSCVSRYARPPIHCTNGGAVLGDVLVARADQPQLCAEADALTERALRGLDAPDGIFHLEAFRAPGGLVFGECAMRLGGGMIPEAVALTYGVDLSDMAVALALDASLEVPRTDPEHYYGYVYLKRIEGVALTEDDFRRAVPSVYEIDYPAATDARVGAYGRIGFAMLRHADSNVLFEHAGRLSTLNERGS